MVVSTQDICYNQGYRPYEGIARRLAAMLAFLFSSLVLATSRPDVLSYGQIERRDGMENRVPEPKEDDSDG